MSYELSLTARRWIKGRRVLIKRVVVGVISLVRATHTQTRLRFCRGGVNINVADAVAIVTDVSTTSGISMDGREGCGWVGRDCRRL